MTKMNGPRALVSVFFVAAFVMSACPAHVAARGSEDEKETRSFIESVAAATYAAAWPSATYEKASIKKTTKTQGGLDVLVRLLGESTFGGELWLDLVFEIRNGGLHDMQVARHNAILVPPFETVKALGAVVEEIAREYNTPKTAPVRSVSASTSTSRAGAVCLRNPTASRLRYSFRWGDGTWESTTLDPNTHQWHSWTHKTGESVSPRFSIRYDDSFAEGYTEQGYRLERNAVAVPASCAKAKKYAFSISGESIELREAS